MEIIQVNPDENSLLPPFQRDMPFSLDEEGAIIALDELPGYEPCSNDFLEYGFIPNYS